MALANERAGYVSSPLPSVAGQVEVAPGGAGGRARACGGESGRVTVVTDHLSVRGEAGREGKGREGGSARFRSRSRGRGGAPWSGPLPARRGREQGLVRGGWWWWWCTRAVPLALPPRGCTLPRPASLGSLDFPPSPPCSPSSPLTSTPPSVTPPITGLHQGPQQN